jgi:YebC/PmpR family DNA-binding regulatory protein
MQQRLGSVAPNVEEVGLSGHSKWHSIKHKKGATDKRRGQLFSKLARAIIVAARDGGPDPAGNLALQNAIEKAREASVPKENIERAIARGAGAAGDGDAYEHVTYEGYGPGGIALFVEALTDNRNRTASEVRHVFARCDGSLGESGSVAWLFERAGLVIVEAEAVDEDELMLAAADGGADDVGRDGSVYQVTCAPEALAEVRRAIENARIRVESAQLTMLPKTSVMVEDDGAARTIVRLMEGLEDLDDVQDVYANFDIPEAVLEAATE